MGRTIVETVLNCGLFLSSMGIYSASPDGYFVLDDGRLIVMEIKCPFNYRHKTVDDIRENFNKKKRYRIPCTAFSVNRFGDGDLRVEKNNDHYRQMQFQMYVTGAVLAVYIVKFADMPRVFFVNRDEEFIKRIEIKEKKEFNICIQENRKDRVFRFEKNRKRSFIDNDIDEEIANRLSSLGFYYSNSVVVCFYCKTTFEFNGNIHHDYCSKRITNTITD